MRTSGTVVALVTLVGLAHAGASGAPGGARQETDRLAGFDRLIGAWDFTAAFVEENDWAADFHARVYEWGPQRSIVRLWETAHKEEPDRVVFEGFAYWHPVEDAVKFVGYNVQQSFFLEGEYVVLEPDRIVREYRVHYPPDFVHDTYGHIQEPLREYRGERRLTDANTMATRTFMKVDGEWVPWPTPDAEPFVILRAESGQPGEELPTEHGVSNAFALDLP